MIPCLLLEANEFPYFSPAKCCRRARTKDLNILKYFSAEFPFLFRIETLEKMLKKILFPLFFMSLDALAGTCLKGSFMNKNFEYELLNAKETLVKDFRDQMGIKATTAQMGCINCSERKYKSLSQIIAPSVPKECIIGSLKRQVSQKSVLCKDGNVIMRTNLNSKNGPCVNDNVVDYITHVSNKVLGCFNSLELKNGNKLSINPKTFFSKINNESGFNFSPVYSGGVGVGQMTSIAVREMNVLDSGKAGNGRYILDSLLNSKNSECSSLQEIIKNDKTSMLNNPRKPVCEWVSLNRGFPRSMIYSLGFFSFIRESMKKELQRRAPRFKYDEEFLDYLTLVGYGPKGPARAKSLIRSLSLSTGNLVALKQTLKNETYLKATFRTLKEVNSKAGNKCSLI